MLISIRTHKVLMCVWIRLKTICCSFKVKRFSMECYTSNESPVLHKRVIKNCLIFESDVSFKSFYFLFLLIILTYTNIYYSQFGYVILQFDKYLRSFCGTLQSHYRFDHRYIALNIFVNNPNLHKYLLFIVWLCYIIV